jgi:hypothetical protein
VTDITKKSLLAWVSSFRKEIAGDWRFVNPNHERSLLLHCKDVEMVPELHLHRKDEDKILCSTTRFSPLPKDTHAVVPKDEAKVRSCTEIKRIESFRSQRKSPDLRGLEYGTLGRKRVTRPTIYDVARLS